MKTVRIRCDEFLRLPVPPGSDREEAFARYVRSALMLAGIDPDGPLRTGVDAQSGELVLREARQKLRRRTRYGRNR